MMKVANRGCIRRLSARSLKAAKTRNCIAVTAIALTTLLFMSLFTIAGTIVNSYQQETFRQVGGDFHGTFKDVTEEQIAELSADPRIVSFGNRLMLGMPTDPPFNKAHTEVSYMDENCIKSYFCTPEAGHIPTEGTNEIITDTRVLQLLGVEPEIGAKITLPYYIGDANKQLVTGEFTLAGWWEYDPAGVASMVVTTKSYADSVLADYEREGDNDMTGRWDMNIFLKSSARIEDEMLEILADHGYQNDDQQADNYIKKGVNWAYVGAQFAGNADPMTIAAIAALLLLIIFTGYLIIYNIFRISVASDIRFYGLLKTIGTTGKQLRRMIRQQALALSVVGVPIGLVLGYTIGSVLAPIVMENLSYKVAHTTTNPLLFIGAALFSLITIMISCRKPGRIAGKVSPIEAVRYTEGDGGKAKKNLKRGAGGAKVHRMALANLGRSKGKTVLVVISLALAVVLMQLTYTFANGFDMDKYLRTWVVTDFVFGDATYFQSGVNTGLFTEEDVGPVPEQPGIEDSGRVYASFAANEFVTEDWARQRGSRWYDEETLQRWLAGQPRLGDRVMDDVDLYGMEDFALDQLTVLDGDLAPLKDPEQKAIAAVYFTDDYENAEWGSNWAKVGDTVTLRHIDEWEYRDAETGEVLALEELDGVIASGGNVQSTPKVYQDVEYTVTALVTIRNSMSFRFYGSDQFVLGAERFKQDTGADSILNLLINTDDAHEAAMEEFLKNYTENIDPMMDYESKQSYTDEFESFRGMFLTLGGALSFIIGLVGVLNFLNAVLTSILTRRREFAVLQAIGMTGGQLKKMLVCEGLLYAGLAIAASFVLSIAFGPLLGEVMGSMFWFFTYRATLLPIFCLLPVFAALGVLIPLATYRPIAKQSIVERIRAND